MVVSTVAYLSTLVLSMYILCDSFNILFNIPEVSFFAAVAGLTNRVPVWDSRAGAPLAPAYP